MTIEMRREDFRHAISLATRARASRTTIPILSMVRCRANGSFEAAATDLDLEIRASVDRGGTGDAEFLLADPQSVKGSLGQAVGKELTIALDGKELELNAGALKITQKNSLHTDDHPKLGAVTETAFAASLGTSFIAALARVALAVSKEETRYCLNGVYVHHVEGWNYRLAATDGHRLIVHDFTMPDGVGELAGVIIPRRAVDLLTSMAAKAKDGIAFALGSTAGTNRTDTTAPERPHASRAEFTFSDGKANIALVSKLIDGTFPDYTRVIPTSNAVSMSFKVDDLRRAVLAASVGSERFRAVKLELTDSGADVSRYYADTDTETTTAIACEHRQSGYTVGFNGAYLLDMMTALGGDEIVLAMADTAAPCLVKNPAETSFTGVLMPMRV